MTTDTTVPALEESLVSLSAGGAVDETVVTRGASFGVAWTVLAAGATIDLETVAGEYLLLLPDCGATLTCGDTVVKIASRTVTIVPGGSAALHADDPGGRVIRIHAPAPESAGTRRLGASDTQVRNIFPLYVRTAAGPPEPRVHVVDDYPPSPGMPRARLFQSASISINWVEYDGPRDRTQLSPHSHADFEQGSLALEGDFVHHFRMPWERDATRWVPDAHLPCGRDTLAVIPPGIVHTTEGVGEGRHLLIDVFAPPRDDFIARGQILNSADYTRDAG